MKKIFLTAVVLIFGILYLGKDYHSVPSMKGVSNKIIPIEVKGKLVEYQGYKFKYVYQKINAKGSTLIANFEEKISSTQMINDHNCRAGINGGFYSAQNTPIGLLQTAKSLISSAKPNKLLIGFLTYDGQFHVSRVYSKDKKIIWGLQSGPLLLEDTRTLGLSLKQDKPARRQIFALDRNGDGFIISIYNENTTESGPFLRDLASLVAKISDDENLELMSAINLDGGRHSTFFSAEYHIRETNPIGSLLCFY